jgi:hypothetical protein
VYRRHRENSILSLEKKLPRKRTFSGLLNTQQAQQGLPEQEAAKRESDSPSEGEKRVKSLKGSSEEKAQDR